ncbi:MAG: hypothetical protein WA817_15640, partial [Candidatus Acidiferrum sp.]
VTSVHQTTAGKMIFGRLEERTEQPSSMPRQSASAAATGRGEITGSARADFPSRVGTGSRLPEPPQLERGHRHVFPDPDPD